MECTHRMITSWKSNNYKSINYRTLVCNDEGNIIKWLYQQGGLIYRCWGVECHDMGDIDYFSGSIDTKDINAILEFTDKIYGEWHLSVTYKGIDIQINKPYPNIAHGLSFRYPKDSEDVVLILLGEFEKKFCFPEIKERVTVR